MGCFCTDNRGDKSGRRKEDGVLTEALAAIVAGGAVALPMLPLLPYDRVTELSTIVHMFSLLYFLLQLDFSKAT